MANNKVDDLLSGLGTEGKITEEHIQRILKELPGMADLKSMGEGAEEDAAPAQEKAPTFQLECTVPSVVRRVESATERLRACSAAGTSVLLMPSPSLPTIQAVLAELAKALSIPTAMLENLAPLPVPEVPFPLRFPIAESDLRSAEIVLSPYRCSELLIGSALPTAHRVVPPAWDSPERSPAKYAGAAGYKGRAEEPGTAYNDRAGSRSIDGIEAWQVAAAEALTLVEDLLVLVGRSTKTIQLSFGLLQDTYGDAVPPKGAGDDLVYMVTILAAYAVYAPWNVPLTYEAARKTLHALAKSVGDGDLGELISKFGDEFLTWAKRSLRGDDWKRATRIPARYVSCWLVAQLDWHHWTAERVALALPIAFRLSDDWEATNGWLGVSTAIHIVANAPGPVLQAQRAFVQEVLHRASVNKHPLVAYIRCASLPALLLQLHGKPKRGPAAADIDTCPYMQAAAETLATAPYQGTQEMLYSHLSPLSVLLLQLGARCAPLLAKLTRVLGSIASNTSDIRVHCLLMQILRCAATACPTQFSLTADEAEVVLVRGVASLSVIGTLKQPPANEELLYLERSAKAEAVMKCATICAIALATVGSPVSTGYPKSTWRKEDSIALIDAYASSTLELVSASQGSKALVEEVFSASFSSLATSVTL